MKPYMPTCQAVSDRVSALSAATSPSPKRQAAHGRDGEILKDNAEGEGKDEVDDPHGEHLLGEQAVPAEPDRDRRHEERQPLGDDVAERAAGAAMGRAGRDDDNERLVLAAVGMVRMPPAHRRGAPVAEIEPGQEHRAEQRR